jgi:ribosomal protein S11
MKFNNMTYCYNYNKLPPSPYLILQSQTFFLSLYHTSPCLLVNKWSNNQTKFGQKNLTSAEITDKNIDLGEKKPLIKSHQLKPDPFVPAKDPMKTLKSWERKPDQLKSDKTKQPAFRETFRFQQNSAKQPMVPKASPSTQVSSVYELRTKGKPRWRDSKSNYQGKENNFYSSNYQGKENKSYSSNYQGKENKSYSSNYQGKENKSYFSNNLGKENKSYPSNSLRSRHSDNFNSKSRHSDSFSHPVNKMEQRGKRGSDNFNFKPPYSNSNSKPPYSNSNFKPPYSNSNFKPPYSNSNSKPPYSNSNSKPPYSNSNSKPRHSNSFSHPRNKSSKNFNFKDPYLNQIPASKLAGAKASHVSQTLPENLEKKQQVDSEIDSRKKWKKTQEIDLNLTWQKKLDIDKLDIRLPWEKPVKMSQPNAWEERKEINQGIKNNKENSEKQNSGTAWKERQNSGLRNASEKEREMAPLFIINNKKQRPGGGAFGKGLVPKERQVMYRPLTWKEKQARLKKLERQEKQKIDSTHGAKTAPKLRAKALGFFKGTKGKQVINSIKPVTDLSKMVINSIKPVTDSSKSVTHSSKPVTDLSKMVINSIKPVIDSSKSVTHSSKPVIYSTKAVIDPIKLIIDSSKPVIEPTKFVINGTKSLIDVSKLKIQRNKLRIEQSKLRIEQNKLKIEPSKSSKLKIDKSKSSKLKIDKSKSSKLKIDKSRQIVDLSELDRSRLIMSQQKMKELYHSSKLLPLRGCEQGQGGKIKKNLKQIDQGKAKKEMAPPGGGAFGKGLFIKKEARQDQNKTGKEMFKEKKRIPSDFSRSPSDLSRSSFSLSRFSSRSPSDLEKKTDGKKSKSKTQDQNSRQQPADFQALKPGLKKTISSLYKIRQKTWDKTRQRSHLENKVGPLERNPRELPNRLTTASQQSLAKKHENKTTIAPTASMAALASRSRHVIPYHELRLAKITARRARNLMFYRSRLSRKSDITISAARTLTAKLRWRILRKQKRRKIRIRKKRVYRPRRAISLYRKPRWRFLNRRLPARFGVVYIQKTKHNVHCSISNLFGHQTTLWSMRGGQVRGSRRKTRFSLRIVLQVAIRKLLTFGLTQLVFKLKGFLLNKQTLFKAFSKRFKMLLINYNVRLAHNGCRPPKIRRL